MSGEEYIQRFGDPKATEDNFFGPRVAASLRGMIGDYWEGQLSRPGRWELKGPAWTPNEYVAYLGVFQAPFNFAKENACMAAGPSNPIGAEQYPAIFFVPKAVNDELQRRGVLPKGVTGEEDPDVPLNHLLPTNPHHGEHGVSTIAVKKTGAGGGDGVGGGGQGHSSDDGEDDYGKKLTHHYHTEKLLPPGARILEVHGTVLGDYRVIMVCLKIAVAGSPPWWVNLSFMRLVSAL